jgi:hypothetical protein
MSEKIKKILMFGGGAALLYWFFVKPKTAIPQGNNSAGTTQATQATYTSANGSVAIVLNGAFVSNGVPGIDFQVFTYVLADGSLNFLYEDTPYRGDASYQVIKTDKSGLQNAINVTNEANKMTIAVTQNTNPVNIFQQSFDWSGNPV